MGKQFIPLEAGRYDVSCYTHYMITPRAGFNTVQVELSWEMVVRVKWTAPWIVFMKGPMKTEVLAQAPAPPHPNAGPIARGWPGAPMLPGQAAAEQAICPGCGAPDAGNRFCDKCSRQLRA